MAGEQSYILRRPAIGGSGNRQSWLEPVNAMAVRVVGLTIRWCRRRVVNFPAAVLFVRLGITGLAYRFYVRITSVTDAVFGINLPIVFVIPWSRGETEPI